ncbi:MAG: hypothetical protein C0596_02315 [Marinilabiliales bacterium]|nr:MAG: hypothetical protein C0596_02315 [Marinilabiliales bacterium]
MKKLLLLLFLSITIGYCSYSQCSDPYVGEDFNNCGLTAELNVVNATTGYWEASVSGSIYSSLSYYPDNTSHNAEVTIDGFNENHYLDVVFTWNDDSGPCSDNLTVKFVEVPVATIIGEDELVVCGNSVSLTADTTGYAWAGAVQWFNSGVNGFYGDINTLETEFSFNEYYFGDSASASAILFWQVNSYGCYSRDTVWVDFYQMPDVNLDEADGVCGLEIDLNTEFSIEESENYFPSGSWYVVSKPIPTATANILLCTNPVTSMVTSDYGIWQVTFTEYNSSNTECYDVDTINLDFVETPVIDAGDDFDVCGTCFTLAGQSAGYTGEWLPNGCSYETYWDEETDVCCNAYGVQNFIWLETNNSNLVLISCSAFDTVSVSLWKNPTPNIINDFTDSVQCGLTFNDLVSESPGSMITGHWYSESPGVSYEDVNSTYTEVTVPTYDKYDFYWIEYSGPETNPTFCSDTAGPLSIYFLNNPEVYAVLDESYYGNEYPLSGEILSSTNQYFPTRAYWWTYETVYFDDFSSLQTIVNVPAYQEYEIILIGGYENVSGCTGKDTVLINFLDQSEITSNTIILDILSADASIDLLGNKVLVSLYRDFTVNEETNIVLMSQEYNGNTGQVSFTDLEDGIYYVKSQIVEPDSFSSIVPSYCYFNAIDELEALPISMGGGSVLQSYIEHPFRQNPFGGNSASGIVGYYDENILIGMNNISVILFDDEEMEILDLCLTNEDGEYLFPEIPNTTDISMFVSSFLFPNREVFSVYTGFNEYYNVNFITELDSVWPQEPSCVEIENYFNDVVLYPNPAKGSFKIISEQQVDQVFIYYLNSRLVLKPNNLSDYIDISNLQSGIYVIELWFEDEIKTKKIIKQ